MSGTIKDSVRETITALIANITNFNSKRMVVTVLFLVLSYKVIMFTVPIGHKPLIDPTIVYAAMAGALGYWMKKESENPTSIENGEKTNGYTSETKKEITTETYSKAKDDPNKANGKVNDNSNRPSG